MIDFASPPMTLLAVILIIFGVAWIVIGYEQELNKERAKQKKDKAPY